MSARRLLLGTSSRDAKAWATAALLLVALPVLSGTASARPSKPPVCRDGRFVIPPGAPPLLAGATPSAPEAVVIEGSTSTVSIAGQCPAVRVHLRATRRGTKVTAFWPRNACGPTKVRLKATIDPGCHTMQGMLRASRFPPAGFAAPRCGDGVMDTAAGEVCDGDAGCGTNEECTADCRCVDRSASPPVSFGGEVQPIFNARCAVPLCHSGGFPTQGLDLSAGRSYAAIVSRPSTERPGVQIVHPGAPDSSYLTWKIGGPPAGKSILGSPMPLSGGPLSAAEQATIRKWIAEGALDDQPITTTSTSTTLATAPSTSTTIATASTTTTTLPATVSFSGDVQPIFTARCALPACHSGSFPTGGLNLSDGSSFAAIVGRASTEKPEVKLIDPNSPTTSYLVWKVSKAPPGQTIVGLQMPYNLPPLSLAEMETIRTWVMEGALQN